VSAYLRKQTIPQQMIVKQTAIPMKPTAIVAATTTADYYIATQ